MGIASHRRLWHLHRRSAPLALIAEPASPRTDVVMRMLFVMDPIGPINIKKDTTFAFMEAAQRRGHEVFHCEMDGLGAGAAGAWVWATPTQVQRVVGQHAILGPATRRPLSDFDVVFMRKDPPADVEYMHATRLLELVDPAKTLVVNRPSGLRAANEKTFILRFGDVIPDTIVTRRSDDIRAFCREHGGRAVIKPLDLMGGAGIFVLGLDDPNFNSIVEQSTNYGTTYVMVQRFVPEAKQGDKRVLLIDGEPLGAILRVPPEGEFRGNMAVGGSATISALDDADRRIIDAVLPTLREHGLWFVGLDVIGGVLTEVNVTSPTGIQEVAGFDGTDPADRVIAWAEER